MVGITVGFITTYSIFSHSWTSIIFWAAVGLLFFSFSPNRRATIYAGAIYGFTTITVWLASGFQGASSQKPHFLLVILIASTIGGLAAAGGGFLFGLVFRKKS
jgi:hypothetical protein